MQHLVFDNRDRMPVLGLGTWKSEPGEVYEAVREALRIGYRHVDCAHIYGNEAEIGQAFSDAFAEGVLSRNDLWVTSKLWNDAHAPADVRPAVENTLSNLQLDYLDLYLVHWPVVLAKGLNRPESANDLIGLDELPLSDTWGAMEELVGEGVCRHIGVSNFSISKLKGLVAQARITPEMNQIEMHPYLQQPEMLEFCSNHGIHLTAYSPLGSPDRPHGMKEDDEPVLLEDPAITRIAGRLGATPAQVLIKWAIQRGTAVIPKSTNPQRLKQNLEAVALTLTEEDMEDIGRLDRHRRYIDGTFWALEGSPYTLENLWDE